MFCNLRATSLKASANQGLVEFFPLSVLLPLSEHGKYFQSAYAFLNVHLSGLLFPLPTQTKRELILFSAVFYDL